MNTFMHSLEIQQTDQRMCLGIAAACHLALFLWNPVLFENTWRQITLSGHGTVIIVDIPGASSEKMPGSGRLIPLTARGNPMNVIPAVVSGNPVASTGKAAGSPITKLGDDARIASRIPRISLPLMSARSDADILISQTPAAINSVPIASHAQVAKSAHSPLIGRERAFHGIPNRVNSQMVADGGAGRVILRFSEPPIQPAPIVTERVVSPAKSQNNPVIEGPLANRRILNQRIPVYPEWAQEQGIMGVVKLYIMVNATGVMGTNIRIEQTSGQPELDRLAMDALKEWRFSPAPADSGQQWGIVTFIFSLQRE